jgi:hypothetical protein
MPDPSEQAAFEALQHRLCDQYPAVPEAEINSAIHAALSRFEESSIRDFVPLLVERRVVARLNRTRNSASS